MSTKQTGLAALTSKKAITKNEVKVNVGGHAKESKRGKGEEVC